MLLEKFNRILGLLKDARSISARLLLLGDPRTTQQVILLQKLLDRIQTSTISVRADLIETVFTDKAAKADDPGPAAGRILTRKAARGRFDALPFNRRHRIRDRRRRPAYVPSDRRSGLADRRRASVM